MSKRTCPVCRGNKGWWIEKDGKREWVKCDWCDATGQVELPEEGKR